MKNLTEVYDKYRDDFKELEKLTKELYDGNPFQYEQALFINSEHYFGRDGRILQPEVVFDDDGSYAGMKDNYIIAPAEKKLKIDAYWEQRDKVNELLLKDEEFQKLANSKDYTEGPQGLDALFWISHFAIKHKIYPLEYGNRP